MQHFIIGENFGLMICRQQKSNGFYHCLVHEHIAESSLVSNNTSEIGYSFPLYLFIKNGIADNDKRPYHKQHNLNDKIILEFCELTGLKFTDEKEEIENTFAPIDILDYIYAVLHSPSYRERYKEFLKIDFPRIPYPQDAAHFWACVHSGSKLRRLHLMDGVEPQEGIADFPIAGSNEVESIRFTPPLLEGAGGRLYINDTQYFDHVPSEAWNFYIGGYQPAQKWLKDRKGRILNYEDIRHYQKIIVVLKMTDNIMETIEHEKR